MFSTALRQYALIRLQRCVRLSDLKQLQAFLTVIGESQAQFFAYKLVRFCTIILGDLKYARLMFDHLRSPDIFIYTAMITAYASFPRHRRSAFTFYREMLYRGYPRPDRFIYPHVLKSCSEVLESHGTEQVHSQILRSGFGHYSVVQNSLLYSYSKGSFHIRTARQLFNEIASKDIASWTAMISWYARSGMIGDALLLFDEMPERDTFSWNALISKLTQTGFFTESISLFRRMLIAHSQGIHPDFITMACVISSCGNVCALQLGRSIHGYAYRNNLWSDLLVTNSLLDMYGKCGSLKHAKYVFTHISRRSISSWNSMINCLALHGKSKCAITIFEEMVKHGESKPDELTFMGLLNACTHGGLVVEGRFYFELMSSEFRIQPQIEHYGCIIDLLGRAGLLDEAMDVIKGMRIEPDEAVWASLLNGCMNHGRTDLAEFTTKKLVEIDAKNVYYLAMLAGMYGRLGKWDEVRRVRKLFMEQKASQPSGSSWIEVDGQVHGFTSGDERHPRTDEIYNILKIIFSVALSL